MNITDFMLSEISHAHKDKHCMRNPGYQIHRQKVEWWLPGAEGRG
jgi:hypothetical protein